jgi:ABC-2 type transport system permease protein
MSTATDANTIAPDAGARGETAIRPTKPFYWSVRRELWEHRSIWIAPLAAAGLVLFGFLIRLARLPHVLITVNGLPPMKQTWAYASPFAGAAVGILVVGLVVAVFYCLGSLGNERRDRSILFWKSLPVSDLTTVLAKAVVPLLIVPFVVLVVAVATQLVMLLIGSGVLLASGMNAAAIWTHWPMGQMTLAFAYLLAVITLWYAPIYGWFMLVSAWARRMAFLWAVLPPIGISIVERIAFDTSWFGDLINYRVGGFVEEAFASLPNRHHIVVFQPVDVLNLLAPAKFLSTPGLWVGLLVAVAFFAAAVYLRRGREPA